MPRKQFKKSTKQKGGSPASDNVNNINQNYLKALAEIPVNGQVHKLSGCQKGGSPASNKVHSLLNDTGNNGSDNMVNFGRSVTDHNLQNLPLYKTSGGGKKRGRKSQKAGGSDWISSQYSRGPVNYPSNPELFKTFAGPYDKYISNESLYYEGLKPNSASNYAPWPFPQKGGKGRKGRNNKHSKKNRKKVRKTISGGKYKRKSNSHKMKGGNKKKSKK